MRIVVDLGALITKMAERGKFIVIEGTDGSGKGTQIRPLVEYATVRGNAVQVIDFPRYKDNVWGELVGRYLKGEFGGLDIDPHLAALPYVLDRVLAKPLIEQWLSKGNLVIANRYASSNLAFMGARLPEEERDKYIDWLEKAEYKENKIPREDLVLLLNVTPHISHHNVGKKAQRAYLGDKARDIHEDNLGYQSTVAKVYLHLAQTRSHWRVVECMDGDKMKPQDEITTQLIATLAKEGILK